MTNTTQAITSGESGIRTNLYLPRSIRIKLLAMSKRTGIPMSAFAARALDKALTQEEIKANTTRK